MIGRERLDLGTRIVAQKKISGLGQAGVGAGGPLMREFGCHLSMRFQGSAIV